MIEKLSQKDIRALKIGVVAVIAILLFVFVTNWLGHWAQVRKSLAQKQAILKTINPSEVKRAGLLSIVPVFEMPQSQEKQMFLFRDKLNEQLKKAGIRGKPLKVLPASKSKQLAGYRLLRLQCRGGKCSFGQILDLLANLKENPYLVGIEEIRIKCDEKNREKVELDLTVSTFTK